jgi:hypothetical protein
MTYDYNDVVAEGETEGALRVRVQGVVLWAPKALIDDDSDVHKQGHAGTLRLREIPRSWSEGGTQRDGFAPEHLRRAVERMKIAESREERLLADLERMTAAMRRAQSACRSIKGEAADVAYLLDIPEEDARVLLALAQGEMP